MAGNGRRVFCAAGEGGTGFGGFDPGKGALLEDSPDWEGRFELFDTFDAEVAAAGGLLVSTEAGLVLLGGTDMPAQPPAAPGFVARMPAGPVTEALSGPVSPLRALMAVAAGTALRRRLKLVDDEEKTLLRCELWELRPEAGTPVSLAVLSPLRGYEKAFRRAEAHFGAAAPLDAAEAAALLRGPEAGLPAGPAEPMTADETAFDAATGLIRDQLAIARCHEPGMIADIDTEFLHDYRVALRRVRSVVSLFKGVFSEAQTESLKSRFGALMARTGRLRDLDVYLLEREQYMALVPEARRGGIGKLFGRFAAERDAEQRKLAAWIGTKGYAQEIARLEKLFAKPKKLERGPEAERHALGYARQLIWKRYRKVCKLAQGIGTCPDEQVHELRIHCKKLRYLMEFFAPLFGEAEVKRLIKALKKLQDNLGLFNDYSVQQVALEEAAAGIAADPGPETVEIAAAIGALVTVLHQRQRAERDRVAASFAAFDSEGTRAEFRKLFNPGEDTA
ncbi:CHAD domain-containing protein [Mangrovicoccus sp. HB161399]|uniref:CHAD domain-containing protein n=1 Tax=Mangrovicoccus sp. HB161399 TaxID=2720392 RepID=UPI001556EF03|nr:CHAD domain-containing protein [Mangrovicoccus sp. HB161399]